VRVEIRNVISHTVADVLKQAYHEAKQELIEEQKALKHIVDIRGQRERQLVLAKESEALVAERCQRAADRLKDIVEFLRGAGILDLSGTGEFK
jgi:hypothetical protein